MEKKITATPRGCDSARVEQVIVTRALKGAGTEMTPVERSFSIGLLTENCSAKRVNQIFLQVVQLFLVQALSLCMKQWH